MTRRLPTVLAAAALLLAAALTLLPLAYLLTSSLKSNEHFFSSLLLPRGDGFLGVAWSTLTLDHYARLFRSEGFGRSLLVSLFLASVTATLASVVCAAAGYALAKFRFKGRAACTALVLSAVLIPAPLLLAPGYRLLHGLGLLDTFSGLILPALAPAFGVFLFRQAILASVPDSVLESARIDGAGELRTFALVVLPLVKPMTGTFMMITFLGVWNNFITPQVVLQSPEKFPVAVAVAHMRGAYYQDYGLQMAATALSVLPVVLIFLALQRDFVSGLTSGAVKG